MDTYDYKQIVHHEIDRMIDESFDSDTHKYCEEKMIMAYGAIILCTRLGLAPFDYAERVKNQILGIMANQIKDRIE